MMWKLLSDVNHSLNSSACCTVRGPDSRLPEVLNGLGSLRFRRLARTAKGYRNCSENTGPRITGLRPYEFTARLSSEWTKSPEGVQAFPTFHWKWDDDS